MLLAQQTIAKDTTTTRGLRTQHNKHLNTKHKQKNNDIDIIAKEDVAFFTQISRGLSIPMPPPSRPPTPRPPTPRPPTPSTPAPVPVPVPNPTNPPVTPTPPPVPAPVPVARPDTAFVSAGGDLAFVAVLGNDTPAPGETLTVKSVTAASNGDCSIGLDLLEVVYSPNDGFIGIDSCDYAACDSQSRCVIGRVTFTVGTTGIVTTSELDGEIEEVKQANIVPQGYGNIVQNGYANIVPNRGSSRSSGKSGKGSGKSGKASSGKSGKGSGKSSKGSSG